MKLYTRRGDEGETSLWKGERVEKCDPRIEAIGCIDELNASIGLCIALLQGSPRDIVDTLVQCQNNLFILGSELAKAEAIASLPDDAIDDLEGHIDRLDEQTPPLKQFILPGGTLSGAQLHVTRTIARRAERSVVALTRETSNIQNIPRPTILRFLNRLSDYLFVAARYVNEEAGVCEHPWHAPKGNSR